MAAPMVSGAIAVMRQALDAQGLPAQPLEIEELLFATGDPIENLPFGNWRRINLGRAAWVLAQPCPDLNGDGMVDTADLSVLLATWGPCEDCPGDLNFDDSVNAEDLAPLMARWGPCD